MAVKDNVQNVAKFDKWSGSYDSGRMTQWFTDGQARTIEAFGLKQDSTLLDVGCGTGWAVRQTAELVPDGKACGIDISPGMISRATEQAEGVANVEFKLADAESIPYRDETFDAVMCTNSFHHYSSPVMALREMRRVLKAGGQLMIRDPDRGACLWVRLWDTFNRAFEKGHVRYYTLREAQQTLEEAGFAKVELVAFEHRHFQKGKIGSAVYVIRATEVKS